MKKVLAIATMIGVLVLPAFSLAASSITLTYVSPGYQGDVSSMTGTFDFSCGTSGLTVMQYSWGGETVATLTDLGGGSYSGVFNASTLPTDANPGYGYMFNNNASAQCGSSITFTPEGSTGGSSTGTAITMPTTTASSLTADIGAQFADPGTLLVIGLAAGIPLTFYVMEQLIALLPGNSKNRRK
jgi:hypothetical protein